MSSRQKRIAEIQAGIAESQERLNILRAIKASLAPPASRYPAPSAPPASPYPAPASAPPAVATDSKLLNSLNLAFTRKNSSVSSMNTLKSSKSYSFVDKMIKNRKIKTVEPGVLTVSAFAEFYPLAYLEADASGRQQWKGLDVELIRAFGKLMGYRVKFVNVPEFNHIWDLPRQGVSDLAISGIANSIGPDGPRGGDETEWTLPYFYVNRSAIIKKGTEFPKRGSRVAAREGSTGWNDSITRGFTSMGELVPATTDDENIAKLLENDPEIPGRKKLNAIMHGNNVSRALIRKSPHRNNLRMVSWEMVPTLMPKDGEIFAYPTKRGSGIATALSSFITKSVINGYLEHLVNKYHMDLVHHIHEGVIPTGEFNAPRINPAYDLSSRIKLFLGDDSKVNRRIFNVKINQMLNMRRIADPIQARMLSQVKNVEACDPQLLSLYLYALGKNGIDFTSIVNLGIGLSHVFSNEEFKFISVKYVKPGVKLRNSFNYNSVSRTLTIDCKYFINEIKERILAARTIDDKFEIYNTAAKEFVKQCIAEILYKSMHNPLISQIDVYNKCFRD